MIRLAASESALSTGTPEAIQRDWDAIVEDSEARRSCSTEAAQIISFGRLQRVQHVSQVGLRDVLALPPAADTAHTTAYGGW